MDRMMFMITIEIGKKDLMDLAKADVGNLPGTFFAGASPLLKPFMKKLEELLPPEKMGRGNSYILSALHSHVDEVHADEEKIEVVSGEKTVVIGRDELCSLMGEKYPSTDHQRLNLPGLLFLQSSPAVQSSSAVMLRRRGLHVPEGRRTLRYIFHLAVVSIYADKDVIKVGLDLDRLPKKADGTGVLD